MPTYQFDLTFTEELLGAAALDRKTYETFILPKMPSLPPTEAAEEAAEELNSIRPIGNGMDSKGVTGFHRTPDGKPAFMNYVTKGFCKGACGALRRLKGTESATLVSYKSVIDVLVFPQPRLIVLNLPARNGAELDIYSSALRADTAKGPRSAISTSERMPAGTTCTFTLNVLGVITESLLREWFDYGALHGMGKRRNDGYGSFEYTMTRI